MNNPESWEVEDAETALLEVVRQGARGAVLQQYCVLYAEKINRSKRFFLFAETVRRTVAAVAGEAYSA